MGWIEEWREKREEKKDMKEYYGLTPEQIAVCKEAKYINEIKYEEALKIRWEEIAKNAIRPDDEYHKNLLKNVTNEKDDKNEEENYVIKISPGTPRRRRRSVKI